MVVQAKPLQTLIRLRVIDQDKQGIVQMLSFGVFTKGGDLHNPFKGPFAGKHQEIGPDSRQIH